MVFVLNVKLLIVGVYGNQTLKGVSYEQRSRSRPD